MDAETKTKSKPKTVTVIVNNREVILQEREITGAEIKDAAGVPPEFQLFREHGSRLEQIGDEQVIKVREGERFRAVSGQDVS